MRGSVLALFLHCFLRYICGSPIDINEKLAFNETNKAEFGPNNLTEEISRASEIPNIKLQFDCREDVDCVTGCCISLQCSDLCPSTGEIDSTNSAVPALIGLLVLIAISCFWLLINIRKIKRKEAKLLINFH